MYAINTSGRILFSILHLVLELYEANLCNYTIGICLLTKNIKLCHCRGNRNIILLTPEEFFWLKVLFITLIAIGYFFYWAVGLSPWYGSTYLEAIKVCLQIRRNILIVLKTFIDFRKKVLRRFMIPKLRIFYNHIHP